MEHVLFFPYIGNNNPNWPSYFSEGRKPPTRYDTITKRWKPGFSKSQHGPTLARRKSRVGPGSLATRATWRFAVSGGVNMEKPPLWRWNKNAQFFMDTLSTTWPCPIAFHSYVRLTKGQSVWSRNNPGGKISNIHPIFPNIGGCLRVYRKRIFRKKNKKTCWFSGMLMEPIGKILRICGDCV